MFGVFGILTHVRTGSNAAKIYVTSEPCVNYCGLRQPHFVTDRSSLRPEKCPEKIQVRSDRIVQPTGEREGVSEVSINDLGCKRLTRSRNCK